MLLSLKHTSSAIGVDTRLYHWLHPELSLQDVATMVPNPFEYWRAVWVAPTMHSKATVMKGRLCQEQAAGCGSEVLSRDRKCLAKHIAVVPAKPSISSFIQL